MLKGLPGENEILDEHLSFEDFINEDAIEKGDITMVDVPATGKGGAAAISTTNTPITPMPVRKDSVLPDANLAEQDPTTYQSQAPLLKKKQPGRPLPPLPWATPNRDVRQPEASTMDEGTDARDETEPMTADELIEQCRSAAQGGLDGGSQRRGPFEEGSDTEVEDEDEYVTQADRASPSQRSPKFATESASKEADDANGSKTQIAGQDRELYLPSTAAHHITKASSRQGQPTFDLVQDAGLTLPSVAEPAAAEDAEDVEDDEQDDVNDVPNFTIPDTPEKLGRSLEKLIVAILGAERDNGRASLTLKQIVHKIGKLSPYYGDQIVDDETASHPWTKNVEDILHQYDFPTVPFVDENDGELHFSLLEGGEWFILNKPTKGEGKPFQILKLPIELRLMIYTLVLHHPLPEKTGWAPDTDYTLNRTNLYARYDRPPQRLTAPGPGGWLLRTRPVREILALTMASQQMQREALPVFYRTNTFYFPTPKIMGRFYSGIPSRGQWMRNIILNFAPEQRNHECKRSIAKLFHTKLRHLHLIADEADLQTKHFVSDITRVPGVKFLAELSGLDRVTFQGDCKNLKRYLAHAEVTSMKNREQGKLDTDEEMEIAIERQKRDYRKEAQKAYRHAKREARKAQTERKRDAYKQEVQERTLGRSARKQRRLDGIEARKDRNRRRRDRERRERAREEEEEHEAKLERRQARKDAIARRRQAQDDEKAQRREEREAARAARASQKAQTQEQRRKEAQRKIKEQRQAIRQKLRPMAAAARGGRKSAVASVLRNDETTESESDTEDESDFESDPEFEVARKQSQARKTVARKAPLSSSARKRPAAQMLQPSDSGSTTEDEDDTSSDSDSEPPPPPKKTKTTPFSYGGSIKNVANNLKRSSGTGGAPKPKTKPKMPVVAPAAKLAAMRKTLQAKTSKGCSGAARGRGGARASASPLVGKSKQTIVVSDGGEEDDDEFMN